MNRFQSRIREKALDAAAPPIITVAFGDSVTQGVAEHRRLDPPGAYHALLQRGLEDHYPTTTFSTLDAGVAGSTARQALSRLERDVIRHQPDLVLIAFGLNDAVGGGDAKLPEFEAALREIVATTHARTEADIVLLTPPHMATRRHAHRIHPEHEAVADSIITAQTSGTLARYADAIRSLGHRLSGPRLMLADIHSEWTRLRETGTDTDLWLVNGLNHPDARGHRLSATLLLSALIPGATPR